MCGILCSAVQLKGSGSQVLNSESQRLSVYTVTETGAIP